MCVCVTTVSIGSSVYMTAHKTVRGSNTVEFIPIHRERLFYNSPLSSATEAAVYESITQALSHSDGSWLAMCEVGCNTKTFDTASDECGRVIQSKWNHITCHRMQIFNKHVSNNTSGHFSPRGPVDLCVVSFLHVPQVIPVGESDNGYHEDRRTSQLINKAMHGFSSYELIWI